MDEVMTGTQHTCEECGRQYDARSTLCPRCGFRPGYSPYWIPTSVVDYLPPGLHCPDCRRAVILVSKMYGRGLALIDSTPEDARIGRSIMATLEGNSPPERRPWRLSATLVAVAPWLGLIWGETGFVAGLLIAAMAMWVIFDNIRFNLKEYPELLRRWQCLCICLNCFILVSPSEPR